jgi:hypothetical protein
MDWRIKDILVTAGTLLCFHHDTTCNETSDGDFSNNYDSYHTNGFTDTDNEVERNDDYQMKIKGISDRVFNVQPPNPI